ncbi:DNA helicase [Tanacetum coccineum]
MSASDTNQQELLFVYGHGGTGKTFLLKTIISSLQSLGKILLAVASSGIASLLLPAGRTAHSRHNAKRPDECTRASIRGETVILSGDFCQTLPVKKGTTKAELITTSIAESYLCADETGLSQLIDFIYDDITLATPTAGSLQEKVIVCPKNTTADAVNAKIMSNIEGQSRTYLSNDEAIPMGRETSET